MTYCLAIQLDAGLVLASDSRTNAGLDQISAYRKMHTFRWEGERFFALLSAGNLATTQAVVKRLQQESAQDEFYPTLEESAGNNNLRTVPNMTAAADYVGALNTQIQKEQIQRDPQKSYAAYSFEATFILGGQIGHHPPELFLIYPQGNYIREPSERPFLQIGETKYGKPILDRVVRADISLELAARSALVSLDSTIRSNLSVGPPIDLLIYYRDSLSEGRQLHFKENDPFLHRLTHTWHEGLNRALDALPLFAWEEN